MSSRFNAQYDHNSNSTDDNSTSSNNNDDDNNNNHQIPQPPLQLNIPPPPPPVEAVPVAAAPVAVADPPNLLQQLLQRLHQAHDSIELDPIQGQFLLDASGGDLDLAASLYWEHSVVAHASASASSRKYENANYRQSSTSTISSNRSSLKSSREKKKTTKNNKEHDRTSSSLSSSVSKSAMSSSSNQQQLLLPQEQQQPKVGMKKVGFKSLPKSSSQKRRDCFWDNENNDDDDDDDDDDAEMNKEETNNNLFHAKTTSSSAAAAAAAVSSRKKYDTNNNDDGDDGDDDNNNNHHHDNEYNINENDAFDIHFEAEIIGNRGLELFNIHNNHNNHNDEESNNNNNNNNNNEEERQRLIQQQQQNAAVAMEAIAESANVSDDEAAAAIAEKLWKQIHHSNNNNNNTSRRSSAKGSNAGTGDHHNHSDYIMKGKAYIDAIEKQIQKMTRKRKKKQRRSSKEQTEEDKADNKHHHMEQPQDDIHNNMEDHHSDVDYAADGYDDDDVGTASSVSSGSKWKRNGKSTNRYHSRSTSTAAAASSSSSFRNMNNKKGNNDDDDEMDDRKPSAESNNSSPSSSSQLKMLNFDDAKKGKLLQKLNDVFENNRKRKRDDLNLSSPTSQNHGCKNTLDDDNKDDDDDDDDDENGSTYSKLYWDDFDDHSSSNGCGLNDDTPCWLLWGRGKEQNNNNSNDDNETVQSDEPDPNGADTNAAVNPQGSNNNNEKNVDGGGGSSGALIREESDKHDQKGRCDKIDESGDDDDDCSGNDDDLNTQETLRDRADFNLFDGIIPRTWLSAGFKLSVCATGLELDSPDDTELVRLKSIQCLQYDGTNSLHSLQPPLPPYHCGSTTLLLSLVTALIYSGASIQGNEVNCKSCKRKPFELLSVSERKKEYPDRLSDALSSLLFIAAKESTRCRLEKLAKLEKTAQKWRRTVKKKKLALIYDSDEAYQLNEGRETILSQDRELMIKQRLYKRAKLCSVCHWEKDETTGALKVPLDQLIDSNEMLQLKLTKTNAKDLRSFVWSNISSFMGPGGLALFLEVIVRIHGVPRLAELLKKARGLTSEEELTPLISSDCEKRVQRKWEKDLRDYRNNLFSLDEIKRRNKYFLPHSHDCFSTELLSLIVTGKPQSNLNEWPVSQLGFDFMSLDDIEQIGKSKSDVNMDSPSNTIWLVKGSSSYSVMWKTVNATGDDGNSKLFLNPGASSNYIDRHYHQQKHRQYPFHVNYWNCWHDPRPKKFDANIIPESRSQVESPLVKIKDIEKVIAHPDDKNYYKDYKHWRFRIVDDDVDDVVQHNFEVKNINEWKSYFRLSRREKKLVEMKMGPQINLAVWSVWPGSEIEWKTSPPGDLVS